MISLKTASTASKLIFWARKHAPEIWLGVGIVTGLGATAFTIKSTLHVQELVDDHKDRMAAVHEKKEEMKQAAMNAAAKEGVLIRMEEVKLPKEQSSELGKLTLHEWARTVGRFGKLYAIPVGFTAVSLASYLVAHGLLKKRYLGVVAAYSALQTKYDTLAGGVAKEYGVDTLRRLENGGAMSRAEKAAANGENPEDVDAETVEELTKMHIGPGGWTSLDRIFSEETSYRYDRYNADRNRAFLIQVQNEANRRLSIDKWLDLNWVYHALGMKMTKAGHVMGWLYDPECKGDDGPTGFVSFGLITDEEFRKWVALGCDGTERSVPLHFGGVGFGLIYDRLPLDDI